MKHAYRWNLILALACALGLPGPAHADEVWSVVTSPDVDSNQSNEFNRLTCPGPNDCWAVGDHYTAALAYQTLVAHWDGANWTIVDSPNTASDQTNVLFGVNCVSAGDCWAVGKHKQIVSAAGATPVIVDQTLAEHWDGTAWTIATTPSPQPLENYLVGVACAAASDCWAGGYAKNEVSGFYELLMLHWDGSVWTPQTVPTGTSAGDNYFTSLTCTGTNSCIAVGLTQVNHISQTLALHWDGSNWTVVTTPDGDATHNNLFNAIACAAPGDCWAAGYSDPGPGVGYATFIAHWDGGAWTRVPSPNTDPLKNNFLFAIACVSPTECRAGGRASNGRADQSLVLRWDGATWALTPSASTSDSQPNEVNDIACAASSDCWTAGYVLASGNIHQTLVGHGVAAHVLASLAADSPGGDVSSGPLNVTFTTTASSPSHSGDLLSYTYDFGDGTTLVAGAIASHAYAVAGSYSATVVVADAHGNSVTSAPVSIVTTGTPRPLSGADNRAGGGGAFGVFGLLPLLGALARRRRPDFGRKSKKL